MSNTPQKDTTQGPKEALTRQHIHDLAIDEHIDNITKEFRTGFEILAKYPRSVSIFGSSVLKEGSTAYTQAYDLSAKIAKETGYTVINGGGPGIMEASSRGATEAGGQSVGLRINLAKEQSVNSYNSDSVDFTYFFARKTMLIFAAETYIYFPGGFGTFDELFSLLTLIQTKKIPRVPVVLFDSKYWNPLKEFICTTMYNGYHTIHDHDADLFEITDSMDRVIEIIKKAPVSEWWKNIN